MVLLYFNSNNNYHSHYCYYDDDNHDRLNAGFGRSQKGASTRLRLYRRLHRIDRFCRTNVSLISLGIWFLIHTSIYVCPHLSSLLIWLSPNKQMGKRISVGPKTNQAPNHHWFQNQTCHFRHRWQRHGTWWVKVSQRLAICKWSVAFRINYDILKNAKVRI